MKRLTRAEAIFGGGATAVSAGIGAVLWVLSTTPAALPPVAGPSPFPSPHTSTLVVTRTRTVSPHSRHRPGRVIVVSEPSPHPGRSGSPHPSRGPTHKPSRTPTPRPTPTPTPRPTPTPTHSRTPKPSPQPTPCVTVLVIHVCL